MKIGSHVSMASPLYLEGSVKEALSYNANAMMIYTGPPQNTLRKPVLELHVKEMHELLKEHDIPLENVIVHAPYIINLANTVDLEKSRWAAEFLKQEIDRAAAIGIKTLVLHPGSHVKAGEDAGIRQIITGLNAAVYEDKGVRIALETMAGKGSELGCTFEQLKQIIEGADHPEFIGVCLDTCHIHDAGYDLRDFDAVLNEFDRIIGLDKLFVMHINDSKNVRGARKDRHANIGYGEIGFDVLNQIVHHPRLSEVVKILETPYLDGHAPYKAEIEMLRSGTFYENLEEIVKAGI